MEQEIAGGITDDTANQAAEQALMEAANAMTKDEKDQAPPATAQEEKPADEEPAEKPAEEPKPAPAAPEQKEAVPEPQAAQTKTEDASPQVLAAAQALENYQALQKRMEGKKMSPEMEKELAKAQGELIRQAMDYSAK